MARRGGGGESPEGSAVEEGEEGGRRRRDAYQPVLCGFAGRGDSRLTERNHMSVNTINY